MGTGAVLSARPRPKDVVAIWCNIQMSEAKIQETKQQLIDLLGQKASVDFLRIEGRVALNEKERVLLDNGSSLPGTPMSPSTPAGRSSRNKADKVARNLFGRQRDRALSDTDAYFARSTRHQPRAGMMSEADSPCFSSSSHADDGFNWESTRARQARRQADLDELRALLPSPN